MDSSLEKEFDGKMLDLYKRALSEAGYKANRFLDMLYRHRGLETARLLINASHPSEGYTALWERNRLDLTVEALIHDHPLWHPLFTSEEIEKCRKRLDQYHYFDR